MRDFRATKKYRGEVAARYDEKRAVKDVEMNLGNLQRGSDLLQPLTLLPGR
jgi:hypothetical protein